SKLDAAMVSFQIGSDEGGSWRSAARVEVGLARLARVSCARRCAFDLRPAGVAAAAREGGRDLRGAGAAAAAAGQTQAQAAIRACCAEACCREASAHESPGGKDRETRIEERRCR